MPKRKQKRAKKAAYMYARIEMISTAFNSNWFHQPTPKGSLNSKNIKYFLKHKAYNTTAFSA